MAEVKLNVYDIRSTTGSQTTTSTITVFNTVTHTLGLGGVFHGAIEIYGEEWSFGFCEKGTGVYGCPPRENPFYTYRQSISLGPTNKTPEALGEILTKMRKEWPGKSYDLLNRNCCTFCEHFARELGVKSVPSWLNRLASSVESALIFSDQVITKWNYVTKCIQQHSEGSYSWLKASVEEWKGVFGSNPAVESGSSQRTSQSIKS